MYRIIGMLCIALLVGCDDVIEETKKGFNEGFRENYRTSFIDSCTESSGKEEFRKLCTCIADDLLSQLSVTDLMDTEKTREHVEKVSMQKCQP